MIFFSAAFLFKSRVSYHGEIRSIVSFFLCFLLCFLAWLAGKSWSPQSVVEDRRSSRLERGCRLNLHLFRVLCRAHLNYFLLLSLLLLSLFTTSVPVYCWITIAGKKLTKIEARLRYISLEYFAQKRLLFVRRA